MTPDPSCAWTCLQTHPRLARFFRVLPTALCSLALMLVSSRAALPTAPKQSEIPAGDAADTLAQLSAQAGGGGSVLYSPGAVAGVRTNPVDGRYTAFAAVDLM